MCQDASASNIGSCCLQESPGLYALTISLQWLTSLPCISEFAINLSLINTYSIVGAWKKKYFLFPIRSIYIIFISIIFSWMRQYQRAPSSVKEMKNCFSLSKLHFLILKPASAKVVSGCLSASSRRNNSGKAPEKIECFVDGKKVLVDPGTTVLQVLLPFSFKNLLSSLFLG